jgi:hypothetical protein
LAPKLEFILKGLALRASTIKDQKLWIGLIIVLATSIALEVYGRACGFILTSDSLQYLSAARSFAEQGKFLSPDGSYYTYWQPLFPVILSVTAKPLVLLGWLNIFSKIIMGIVLMSIANSFIKEFIYKIIFLVVSLCSVYTLMLSVFVWSDLLFMMLAYLNLYVALNLKRKNYFYYLLLTGFLLCIQRNAGLFWVGGVCLWLIQDREILPFKNFLRTGIFFLVSTSGLWAWNFYNTFFIPANFNFYKHSFFADTGYNTMLLIGTYTRMMVPLNQWILQVIFFVLVAGCIIYFLIKNFNYSFYLPFCIVLMYTAGYAAMVKLDMYEMDRYLSIVASLVYLLFINVVEKLNQSEIKWIRYGLLVLVLLWAAYPIARTVKNVQFWHNRSCFSESSI